MNHSHAIFFSGLIDRILDKHPISNRRAISEKLRLYVSRRRKASAQLFDGPDSWASTSSEWELLTYLDGLQTCLEMETEEESRLHLKRLRKRALFYAKPLRILFVVQEFSLWASLRSVYDYFQQLGFELDIVYSYEKGTLPDKLKEENIAAYQESGYPIVDKSDYDLTEAAPDMVFYSKPYLGPNGNPKKYYVDEISKHVKYTVFISYCLDVQGGSELYRYFYALPMFSLAWRVITYSDHYDQMLRRYSYCDGENLLRLGHPKFDQLYKAMTESDSATGDWTNQFAKAPIVLWNTHFTISENVGVGTFYENYSTILDFFKTHPDINLLWRPHPYFFASVEEDPRMGKKWLNELISDLSNYPNIWIDKEQDYTPAFTASDALITDATTFLAEFAATGKPVLYTPKISGEGAMSDDYLAGSIVYDGEGSLHELIELLEKQSSDDTAQIRVPSTAFGDIDGENGARIGDTLLNAINFSIQNDIQELFEEVSNVD